MCASTPRSRSASTTRRARSSSTRATYPACRRGRTRRRLDAMRWRRRTRADPRPPADDDPPVFDIVTPGERELRDRAIARRRRRYFLVMGPCIVLVLFGFFVPAPIPLRVAALALAA